MTERIHECAPISTFESWFGAINTVNSLFRPDCFLHQTLRNGVRHLDTLKHDELIRTV